MESEVITKSQYAATAAFHARIAAAYARSGQAQNAKQAKRAEQLAREAARARQS